MDISTKFLFTIIKEVKLYYETPVIYVTHKDYADGLFNSLCKLRTALVNEDKEQVLNAIVDYHLQWLYAVNELENFKKVIDEFSREQMYQEIIFSIDALCLRFKYFQRYMEKYRSSLSNDDQAYLNAELEIVDDMHKENTNELQEKLKCFKAHVGDLEFKIKVKDVTEDLMNWLDKIHDSLSTQLCKYVSIKVTQLDCDLARTLKQIVDEFSSSNSPSALKIIDDMKKKGSEMSSMIRSTAAHNLEISKVIEKIYNLEDRIKRLEDEPTSAAVMALTHKKDYLERRLASLENLKTTIKSLHKMTDVELEAGDEEICSCEDFYKFRIFNHILPAPEREKLVTQLCYLFDLAIFGERSSRKSIISILSAADTKEEFSDDLGTFYIDEHSRKIYKLPNDENLYQPNEMNVLVQVSDDPDHVYFYDQCGRYYLDFKTRQRVYKAHASASEYMMDTTGVLLKIKEVRDGVTYYYDNCGRYFVNAAGNHIYREVDSASEYENDGLGNLVRIRSLSDIFQLCPGDANVTEDFNYLKQTVGTALRFSIAQCILYQPADPIKYLSFCLVKFRENIEIKERRATEKEQLMAEREIVAAEERAVLERATMEATLLTHVGSEASYDSNVLYYTTMPPPDDNMAPISPK